MGKIRNILIGPARDLHDPSLGHKVSLAAFLAWVGLGCDGLSSSAYGPEEAFRALGVHSHLAILLVVMTATTIFVISIAYSNLIQHFPGGGGDYLRVHMHQLRHKLESNPARPRWLINEPGVGYRLKEE